jgi:hypothetical protein
MELLQRADGLIPGENELGVILSQTAVEMYVEITFDVLFQRAIKDEVVRARLGALVRDMRSLKGDRRVRDLWEALTGDVITRADSWKSYDRHVERRNQVIHQGVTVPDEDAIESHEACRGMILHTEDVLIDLMLDDENGS